MTFDLRTRHSEGQQVLCEGVSSPANDPASVSPFAIDCTTGLAASVQSFVQAGVAPATRRAYRADLDHFEAWGGTIPATDDMVAAYIADHATVLKVSTLTRRLAERGNDLAHILRDGTIEPNAATEERLLALTRQTDADLFAPRAERLARAYRNQGLKITRNRR